MKINLGAGNKIIDGFVNCDFDKLSNPDFLFNVETDQFPFETNSVDTVLAHHIFEHLGEGYFHCLQELYRVCKHGAIIDVRVPHYRHWTFAADPTHRRPILPEGLSLFSKKFNDKHADSSASRLGYYYDIDFEILSIDEIPDPNYRDAFNNMEAAQVKQYLNEHNNIVMEYHIRMVVVKENG